ncbi:upper zone of growth plate and cartilage matrix associated a isoform X2 [Scyliorhinus canicula]|uniref:upper zone of growth plate and cartilage matrix associated a isoform X2 n=1 Tax=Scyliorhinus canicula TaxID=7830 RepID=UPI0018F4DDC9|nr:upper zone of growth plate and cartilage matrix associated a isoform X2 [Scyliorhinus canicula]
MKWEENFLLCSLAAVCILTRLNKQVFVAETDASNFFKRRTRRSPKSRAEMIAENSQRRAADERRKEYHEEQLYEWKSYVEEEQDEQYERSHEKSQSWRQWHYGGRYPPYLYNRYGY